MQDPTIALLFDPVFLKHDTGAGHPECPARLEKILSALHAPNLPQQQLIWPAPRPVSQPELLACHSPSYVALVRDAIARGLDRLPTGDTPLSARSYDAAILAAGTGPSACDLLMAAKAQAALCLVRPPGHHASRERGMGFCIFNNAAVTARYAQLHHRLKHVLIADFDVHHGNGTQDLFYSDPSVFYFSVHQDGIYPGTGHARETGSGPGTGFTLNVPLPAHSDDDALLKAIHDSLRPAMDRFRPELVLVSAGFDGHRDDPLGELAYTEAGYAAATRSLLAIAQQHAQNRIILLLEGGYHLGALANSVAACTASLCHPDRP